jgi:hypothetical protein
MCGGNGWVYLAPSPCPNEPMEEPPKMDCPVCSANARLDRQEEAP